MTSPIVETPRLIMRELLATDEEGMFELDGDPLVHRYLGNNPVTSIEQACRVIAAIRPQYIDNGIGRWAVVEKESNSFIGWSGLKLVKETTNGHSNYHDVGYRFIPRYWGKGYATESAKAALEYAFTNMKLTEVFGTALAGNKASQNALVKCGLRFINNYDYKGEEAVWLRISREEWEKNMITGKR